MKYPELQGKCKEYIEKCLCLGCTRLEIPSFIGDDSCYVIKEREEYEKRKEWRIR